MCYSAAASFTASTLLIPVGVLSAISAYQTNKKFIFLALVPVFFGIQQYIEGLIWQRLGVHDVQAANFYAYFYLFFAFAFWPVYMPACVYLIENDLFLKKVMQGLMITGWLVAAAMYAPILLGMIPVTVSIEEHSILYSVYQSILLIEMYTLFYSLVVIFPFLISSLQRMRLFGVMVLISLVVTYLWYLYAFTSIWCFFVALLSFFILAMMYRLPRGERGN